MNVTTASIGVPVVSGCSLRHAVPAGSLILTAKGEVPVETLAIGDRVITRDHGMVVLRDVVHERVADGAQMIMVPENSLGHGRPRRDLRLPPNQPLVLRDWRARTLFGAREARIVVSRLIDGKILRRTISDGSKMCSLILDRPSVIYVDGLELVSGALKPA